MEIYVENLREAALTLSAGDRVYLSGTVYTARDAAHLRIFELLDGEASLPFELPGAVIYYAGPTAALPGRVIGSCGPTTAARMNKFAPRLFDLGLGAVIGKGEMSPEVIQAIVRNKAAYFCAIGGAGALIAKHITTCEEIAFTELGCEAIRRLTLEKLPLFVGYDAKGKSIFA
ncbi:MAG: FumA C-terminus/TtdB family hydratase beta subunit [Oscillospiraceae bacterium]|jgi:fumarate hydratase subunit beta|nr:FumA C-terminus/TtdB family hydratase beta subunit [Oscillospiraceae bacterium]